MPKALNTLEIIVKDTLFSTARTVIEVARQNTPDPYLIDTKLGDAKKAPMLDTQIALMYDKTPYTIGPKWNITVNEITRADAQHGNPLAQIAQRANDVITQAAILNRHNRRPPLYAESTIKTFIQLGCARPEHSPLIRAAGHVAPPPIFPRSHDIGPISSDIAAHMAASHEPQSVAQIIQSLEGRQDLLAKWPQLDLTLFIQRTMGIRPHQRRLYHPDQPWGNFISAQRLIASTMLRILTRDQLPRTTDYLIVEIQRLVGKFLPDGYKTLGAVRATLSRSDNISWQGRSTFGLKTWHTALERQNMASTRGRTGDLIYVYLMQQGPTDVQAVIEHVQHKSNIKRRTIQEAINHDPEDRFVRISNRRVAANPIPNAHNPGATPFNIIPDEETHRPAPVLHQAEFLWLIGYVQALNDLEPPLPARVAITGARAAGLAHEGDTLEITVIVNPRNRASLEHQLAEIAAATSDSVPSVQPQISILSPQQWEHQQSSEAPEAHHNAWLAPTA